MLTLKKFHENKYQYFFLSILILFITAPISDKSPLPIVPFLFLLVIVTVLRALHLSKRVLTVSLLLAISAFLLHIVMRSDVLSMSDEVHNICSIIVSCMYVVFFSIAIKAFLWQIFAERAVTWDTIQGGVSVYFLIGIQWSLFYQIVLLINPNAIIVTHSSHSFMDMLYFSFITLTTLGYGDILPVSDAARILVILEATFGPLFLTVLVARLVALHIITPQKNQ